MKKFVEKYFYQSIVVGLLLVVLLVLGLGYAVTNVFNVEPGYVGADNKVLMSYEDSTLTLDEGIFIAKDMQAYYEEYYLSEGYTVNWDAEYKDGKTYEETILEDTLQLLKEVFLFSEYAKANGYELTSDDQSSITSDAETYLKDSAAVLVTATGANMDLLEKFYTRTTYYSKVCDDIYNNTDFTIDTEDIRNCLVAIATISPDNFDSPEETANKILERVNNGEVMAGVAAKYSAEVTKTNIGPGSLDGNDLETLCLSMADGECKMVEVKGTYYVVYCYLSNDEEATAEAKELKLSELQDEAKLTFYNELLETMSIELDEELWATITFDTAVYTTENINDTLLTE